MKKIPNLIGGISVKYYRSINAQKLRDCKPVNIITGSNDVGKSNLLRALNLFFNEKNEHGEAIVFSDEFSHSRLNSVRQDSIKGRQFIQIEVAFNCRDSFKKTLPSRFKVTKTWFRDSKSPDIRHDLEKYLADGTIKTTKPKAEGSLQRFLNSIVFTYIPAIKDRDIFQSVLGELQTVLFSRSESAGGSFIDDIKRFSADLEKQAQELKSEFSSLTGVDASIALPSTYADLFRAFDIQTKGAFSESVALDHRGDGVRVRFIPAILNYIAERSQKLHVWGFEEPENSMEYRRAFELASTMVDSYSKNAQIFLTTHSPAFINLEHDNQSIYMATLDRSDTVFTLLNSKKKTEALGDDPFLMVAGELGHISLMNELHKRLQQKMASADEASARSEATLKELATIQRPVLLTEGKTDAQILRTAWDKLKTETMPFEVKSCSVLGSGDKNEAAGAPQLSMCLRSILHDHPSIVIGLFDRDVEGEKGWKLDRNFSQADLFSDVRSSKNNKAHAILMPVPKGGEAFEQSKNLCIEFMFPKEALERKIDGKGLELEAMPIQERCGLVVISKKKGTELWQMKVKGGKTHFAEKVAPSLEPEYFSEFEKIFEIVQRLIADYDAQNPTQI